MPVIFEDGEIYLELKYRAHSEQRAAVTTVPISVKVAQMGARKNTLIIALGSEDDMEAVKDVIDLLDKTRSKEVKIRKKYSGHEER